VAEAAEAQGLSLERVVEVPANNIMAYFAELTGPTRLFRAKSRNLARGTALLDFARSERSGGSGAYPLSFELP
jgi:hypothetical protein